MSLKLGHKIFLLVSVPLVFILLVIGLFAFVQRTTVAAAAIADHSDEVLAQTRMLWESMLEAEDNERAYIITKSPVYLEGFRRSAAQMPQHLAQLEQLAEDNSVQLKRLRALGIVAALRLQRLEKTNDHVRTGTFSRAELDAKMLIGSRIMDDLRSRLTVFNDEEFRLHVERDAALAQSLDFFNKLLLICAIVAFIPSLLIMQIFSGMLVRRLAELGDEARSFAEDGTLRKSAPKGNDEISQLHRSFYAMADIITEKQSVLAR